MEENKTNSMTKYALPLVAVIIIIVAVVAVYTYTNNSSEESTPVNTQSESMTILDSSENSQILGYKDGTYTANGNYVSPGGPREIGVTITLAGGVITDTSFEGRADDPTSKRFQGEFSDNYAPMIVGKNIDEVALTKVSGSSLTPIGFKDALEKIKAQAQS
ncbi:MAG TPA: hypothetical protein PLD54_02990 [Candidatus Levybacteria bacterium]|nr:hypothetical protein [Candidatus Levybacteria bacterium]